MNQSKFQNKLSHTYEYIKKQFEIKNYKLLSKKYKNASEKLKTLCPNDHIHWIKYNDFQQGHGCDKCYRNKLRLNFDFIKKEIELNNYKLLSDFYKNSRTKILVECKNQHEYKTTWNRFQQGHRCPFCINNISKAEGKIFNIIKEFTTEQILRNDRSQITSPLSNRKLELDIFIPALKTAIEFNGMYWHEKKSVKRNDRIKKEQCKQKNINLIIIKEKDWNKNKNNVIRKLQQEINNAISRNRYARPISC